mmetsp:Transcript_4333/g.9721  ORF Transcript_4333/g.9721 Transcript_4333/m.9721 type:complete len:227 (-) Transcript_4333:555-1235(-)
MASVSAASASDTPEQQSAPSPTKFKMDYIRTATQNYISRSANILGAPNLTTKGKSIIQADATIHGDYGAPIHVGRYCHIQKGVIMTPSVVPVSSDPLLAIDRPPSSGLGGGDGSIMPPGKNEKALPIIIGSHTQIGSNTHIQSISVGSCVRVGSNCILSPRSKVHDCCIIEDGTVIPPDMVVPPFSRVRGTPGKIVGTLPECCGGEFVECCVQDYLHFVKMLENSL